MAMNSSYDAIAWAYQKYWGPFSVRRFLPVLERLLLLHLPEGAHILDLGCGTGNLARALWEMRYRVTGVDVSAAMVHEARKIAPNVEFLQQDIRAFKQKNAFHAAIALFAVVNHLMTEDDLRRVLNNVKCSLVDGGWFVFDFNTPAGLQRRWQGTEAVVAEDMVIISQGRYDANKKEAETRITSFRPAEGEQERWLRSEALIALRGYESDAIKAALHGTGFQQIEFHRIAGKAGEGRVFVVCRKP